MKKRGFKPNLRTFHTLLAGFRRAGDPVKGLTSTQMDRARNLFGQYQRYQQTVQASNMASNELGLQPVNEYISILASSHLYQEIFDVFYSLDKTGPLSPDQYVFSRMILALGKRKALHAGGTEAPEGGKEDVHLRNAADVRFLWHQMIKASQRTGFPIDSHLIAAALYVLTKGTTADHVLGLSIIRDHLGLSLQDETADPPEEPISHHTFLAALCLCNAYGDYMRTYHFYKHVSSSEQRSIVDRKHMQEVLRAIAAQSSSGSTSEAKRALETVQWMLDEEVLGGGSRSALRPDSESYKLALTACSRTADWATACSLFDLMTGLKSEGLGGSQRHQEDQVIASSPMSQHHIIHPDAEAMDLLSHAALASKEPLNAQQCLNMISHFGPDHFFGKDRSLPSEHTRDSDDFSPHLDDSKSQKSEVSRSQFRRKFARSILRLLELQKAVPMTSKERKGISDGWRLLEKRAMALLGPYRPKKATTQPMMSLNKSISIPISINTS